MTSRISGRVVDRDRRPVADVRISLNGRVAGRSDDDGSFSVRVAQAEGRAALTFSCEGFVSNTRRLDPRVKDGNVVVVWPVAYEVGFDAGRDLDVVLAGSSIRVPEDALAGPRNQRLTDRARLRFTWFDVSSSAQRRAAPGDFSGRLFDGRLVRLRSFGIFDLSIDQVGGRSVRLRPGAAIELSIAVPPRLVPHAPAEVGYFDFEQGSGQWVQVDSFTLAPGTLTYNGTIVRFGGAHNLDDPQETTCITVQVVRWWDSLPMPNFSVTAHCSQSDSYGTTDSNGFVCLLVDRNAPFSVEAHGSYSGGSYANPYLPANFSSPDIESGEGDCGGPDCPFAGQVLVDILQ